MRSWQPSFRHSTTFIVLLIIFIPLLHCRTTKDSSPHSIHTGIALWKLGLLSHETMCCRYYNDCSSSIETLSNNEASGQKCSRTDPHPQEFEQAAGSQPETVTKAMNLTTEESSHKTIFLIRHAQSQYNAAIAKVKKQNEGKDESEFAEEITNVKFGIELIDASITKEGERQAEETAELMKDKNIGIVITSPLRRCLQTTRKIFENHKNKPKVIVFPLIKEISSSSCDLPGDLEEIRREFGEYDFSLLDEYPIKELWFVDILANEELKKGFYDELYGLYPDQQDAIKNAAKLMAKKMLNNFPNQYETHVDLNKRVTNAKKWLKEKLKDVEDGEFMAVVTHSKVLQSFIAKEYGALGEFIGSRRLVNCEVMEYNL